MTTPTECFATTGTAGQVRRPGRVGAWLAATAVAALALTGCTTQQLNGGRSPSFLIISSLTAASGATPSIFGGSLSSDVLTLVKQSVSDADGNQVDVFVPTIYEDILQARFDLGLKDPGTPDAPAQPTSANFITIQRYRVEFFRTDGRNVPGVDVPYPFDSAVTLTITGPGSSTTMTLVRSQAKQEAPLQALINGGGAITVSAIATVTFYGTDQAGREVSASGQIAVNFADWGDPE